LEKHLRSNNISFSIIHPSEINLISKISKNNLSVHSSLEFINNSKFVDFYEMKVIKNMLNRTYNRALLEENNGNKFILRDEIEKMDKYYPHSEFLAYVLKFPLISLSQRHFSSMNITSATAFLNILLDNMITNDINHSLHNLESGSNSNKILSNMNLGIRSESTVSNVVGFYLLLLNNYFLFLKVFQV
jgi:hypothetical protein